MERAELINQFTLVLCLALLVVVVVALILLVLLMYKAQVNRAESFIGTTNFATAAYKCTVERPKEIETMPDDGSEDKFKLYLHAADKLDRQEALIAVFVKLFKWRSNQVDGQGSDKFQSGPPKSLNQLCSPAESIGGAI